VLLLQWFRSQLHLELKSSALLIERWNHLQQSALIPAAAAAAPPPPPPASQCTGATKWRSSWSTSTQAQVWHDQ
jgi:hypothetical protein